MLTPRFKLSQDENHVFITVHAPYTNVKETEIDVDGENFLFVSSPYFLRLCLPGRIVENDQSKGSYICDSGDFSLTFDKECPGEEFENLDMITSLLAPKDIPNVNPDLVEMLEENYITINQDSQDDSGNTYTYGFANKISTEFKEIGTEFPQIFELRVPEEVSVQDRNDLRQKYEDHKFSSDHYLADFFENELIAPYLSATMPWDNNDVAQNENFTDEEISILKDIPNKHYILSNSEYKQVFNGLVDILFAYCYDKRTTLNESTVESSWTINKLSSTLSWFCVFDDIKDTLTASYRRALTYPIFRNFDLCDKIKNDLVSLLQRGKKYVIKCMLNIYQMFNLSNDARYILNQLYIKDYLVFLQQCKAEEFDNLQINIANVNIEKNYLGFDLDILEEAALLVINEEESQTLENEIAEQMASISLMPVIKRFNEMLTTSSSSSADSSEDSDEYSDSDSNLDSDDDAYGE